MNSELVLKFMSQDQPWAFGLRSVIDRNPPMITESSLKDAPFFAAIGPCHNQFRAIGADLEECMKMCLNVVK